MTEAQQVTEQTQKLQVSPEPTPKRGSWYLLTGLVIGLLLGLGYAILVNPAVYDSIHPASLSKADQDIYRATIARAYAKTGHLERAISRLALLEDENPVFTLGVQAQMSLADARPEEAYDLALLASALQSFQVEPDLSGSPTSVPTQTLPLSTATP